MGFFNRLRSAFTTPRSDGDAPAIARILASENPFGVELWDCRAFTQSMISATADQRLAEMFSTLRSSTGTQYRDQAVPRAQVLECDLRYPYDGTIPDGSVFKAVEMEDKWDIYLYSPHLYFARSWSGDLTYRVTLSGEPGCIHVTRFESPRTQDPEFARRVIDYLIKSHILGVLVPHPLPAMLPMEAEPIAALSFSLFGRRCYYGSFSDTTPLRGADPPS